MAVKHLRSTSLDEIAFEPNNKYILVATRKRDLEPILLFGTGEELFQYIIGVHYNFRAWLQANGHDAKDGSNYLSQASPATRAKFLDDLEFGSSPKYATAGSVYLTLYTV